MGALMSLLPSVDWRKKGINRGPIKTDSMYTFGFWKRSYMELPVKGSQLDIVRTLFNVSTIRGPGNVGNHHYDCVDIRRVGCPSHAGIHCLHVNVIQLTPALGYTCHLQEPPTQRISLCMLPTNPTLA